MDPADLDDLSDSEIVRRLVQRGIPEEDARSIIVRRDREAIARQICEALD
jgi:hypothetical protein